MSSYNLFVKINDEYKELSAVAIGPHLKPIKKVPIQEAVDHYIQVCTRQKCEKNQKVEAYYFSMLVDFCVSRNAIHADEVTAVIIEEFESILLSRMKPSSVNRRFNTIKNFFVKCKEWDFVNTNPCERMKKRREADNPHLPWPPGLFDRFIKLTDGVWEKVFTFIWLTGCRPVEANNLLWTDINYDQSELILRCGKNSKVSRKFPINPQLSALLHSFKPDSLHVFSQNKKLIGNDRLYHYCKKRLIKLGEPKYTVYGMRHSFGTNLSNVGVNAFDIAELMGHSKIETTQRYIHKDKKRLISALDLVR